MRWNSSHCNGSLAPSRTNLGRPNDEIVGRNHAGRPRRPRGPGWALDAIPPVDSSSIAQATSSEHQARYHGPGRNHPAPVALEYHPSTAGSVGPSAAEYSGWPRLACSAAVHQPSGAGHIAITGSVQSAPARPAMAPSAANSPWHLPL